MAKRTAVILQPAYLPWLGFFDQLDRADVFVLLDTVQSSSGGWETRNRIKTAQGVRWLTVPVQRSRRFGQLVGELRTHERVPWRRKHLTSLRQAYAAAPYRDEVLVAVEDGFGAPCVEPMAEVNERLIARLAALMGIDTELVRASSLQLEGNRNTRLVAMCRRLGADHYLAGKASRGYLNERLFEEAGIAVSYQDYRHPTYPQLHGAFESHLSIVDLLMNALPDARSIVASAPAADHQEAGA